MPQSALSASNIRTSTGMNYLALSQILCVTKSRM